MAEAEDGPKQSVSAEIAPPAPAPPPLLPPCVELPSFEAAQALAESRYSCLVVMPHRRHVALPPRFLQRKRTGICTQLDAELRRYSERWARSRVRAVRSSLWDRHKPPPLPLSPSGAHGWIKGGIQTNIPALT